jgi:hypothetical protein
MDDTKKEMVAGKERLLCYSAAILSSLLGNPNNKSTVKALIPSSISGAKELIRQVYESE